MYDLSTSDYVKIAEALVEDVFSVLSKTYKFFMFGTFANMLFCIYELIHRVELQKAFERAASLEVQTSILWYSFQFAILLFCSCGIIRLIFTDYILPRFKF